MRADRACLTTLIGVALAGMSFGCEEPAGPPPAPLEVAEQVLTLGSRPVAEVEERYDPEDRTFVLKSRLKDLPDEQSELEARLDERGLVEVARYRRRGPRGERSVDLEVGHVGASLRSGPRERHLGPEPVVLLDALCRARVTAPLDVRAVDLASGESLLGRLVVTDDGPELQDRFRGVISRCDAARGVREGPGAFVLAPRDVPLTADRWHPVTPPAVFPPGPEPDASGALWVRLGGLGIPLGALDVDGPGQRLADAAGGPAGQLDPRSDFPALRRPLVLDPAVVDATEAAPAHRAPDLFIESDAPAVQAFAERAPGGGPLADALALAEAVHDELDTSGGGGPPSALGALARRAGDCDDATALLVASLRARGHAARPVVGYRAFGGRWVPHAWAEVHDGERWVPADAMVPGLGPFRTHLRLFEGLGSPLTIGRTLGALEIAVELPAPAPASDAGPEP